MKPRKCRLFFAAHRKIDLITVQAEELFLNALKGVEDPEQKRKIVGQLFIDIFKAEAQKFVMPIGLHKARFIRMLLSQAVQKQVLMSLNLITM